MVTKNLIKLLALITLVSACAPKKQPEVEVNNAPTLRYYTGTFRWSEEREVQKVQFCFTDVKKDSKGISLKGFGRYLSGSGETNLKVRATINYSTNYTEIFESDPQGSHSFETGGVHRGSVSPDYRSIDAAWTTKVSGQKGLLNLKASNPDQFCP